MCVLVKKEIIFDQSLQFEFAKKKKKTSLESHENESVMCVLCEWNTRLLLAVQCTINIACNFF